MNKIKTIGFAIGEMILYIFAIAMITLVFAPIQAHAADVTYNLVTTSLNGGTNNVSASTTNSSFAVSLICTKGSAISIQPKFKLTGSGTSAVVFKFDRSIDGSTWESAASSVSVTANGTSTVTAVGSVTMASTGYLRLSTVENPNASAITNLVLRYAVKNGL